jgi:hypothetical protein
VDLWTCGCVMLLSERALAPQDKHYKDVAEISAATNMQPPPDADDWNKLNWLGFKNTHARTHDVNRMLRANRIDAMIELGNFNDIFDNHTRFACRSIAWFPNHYRPLDFLYQSALSRFTHIATLAPSDAAHIAEAMSWSHVQVAVVPHIVEPPTGIGKSPLGAARREALRKAHGVPTDAFVVLVTCGLCKGDSDPSGRDLGGRDPSSRDPSGRDPSGWSHAPLRVRVASRPRRCLLGRGGEGSIRSL